MTSCFVYKVIRDLESMDHLCINPIHRIGLIQNNLSIRFSSSGVYRLMFYLTIIKKTMTLLSPLAGRTVDITLGTVVNSSPIGTIKW